jgi:hypothetical protein
VWEEMPVPLLSHPDDLVGATVDGTTFSFFIVFVFAGVHARLWFCDFVLHVCLLSGQYALQFVQETSGLISVLVRDMNGTWGFAKSIVLSFCPP